MPGEQRHEQELPAINPVFILRAVSFGGSPLMGPEFGKCCWGSKMPFRTWLSGPVAHRAAP